jgi:hypothetical protein
MNKAIMVLALLLVIVGTPVVWADDHDDETEIEIELEDGRANVAVEFQGEKDKFTLNTTNLTSIYAEIATRTNLTVTEVEAIAKVDTSNKGVKLPSTDGKRGPKDCFTAEGDPVRCPNSKGSSDDEEVDDMDSQHGAVMRLLQLKRQIDRNTLHMEAVISALNGTNTSANVTSNLNSIVAEMQLLSLEVDAAVNATNNQTKNDSVQTFLDIKAEAKTLIKEFRDAVKGSLDEDEVNQLRKEFNAIDKEKLKEVDARIKESMRLHNSQRLEATLNAMGTADAELVAKVRSGDIDAEKALKELKEKYEDLSDEEKQQAAENLRETHTKRKVQRTAWIENHREESEEKLVHRLEERADWLEAKNLTNASSRLRLRAEVIEERGDDNEWRARWEERVHTEDGERRVEVRERMRDGRLETETRIRERRSNSGSRDDDSDDRNDEDEIRVGAEVSVE